MRIAALDRLKAIASKAQAPMAERIGWMDSADALPAFQRFPVAG